MSDELDDNAGEDMLSCAIGPADHGARLDKALAAHCDGLSRSRLKALILDGAVMLDDVPCTDPSMKVKDGMTVTVAVPPPVADEPEPENIPLDIVFEDECMLVINKQAGLVVHPGAGNWQGTMVNALLYHCGDSLSGIGGVRRPGIVHRLDKDTSGLMVVAKTDEAHQALSAQLSDRTLGRYYTALVWGVPSPPKGSIDQPIGRHPSSRLKMAVTSKNSREARTHYTVQDSYGGAASMTECKLDSGRTHQVRVHMAYLRHPLIGDPLYGLQRTAAAALLRKSGTGEDVAEKLLSFPRQALHAWKIGFVHPRTQEAMMFESCLPNDMAEILNHLKTIS